jgi:serine/threonine protein phosphatase PrpC
VRVAVRCEIGHLRRRNEDAWLTLPAADGKSGVVVVADGMGGHPAGDVASAVAVQALEVELAGLAAGGVAEPGQALLAAAAAAHAAVLAAAAGRPDRRDMGTTVVLGYVTPTEAVVTHVGDSRAYLVRRGSALPLTRDHGDHGYLSAALGLELPARAEYAAIEFSPGDRLVLCTDGLTGELDDSTIADLALDGDSDTACDRLVDAALDAGGHDNVTVIVVDPTG